MVACVVSAGGELPTGRSMAVPNYRFPEYCADVLARAAERREWLSRPVGEPPRYDDLDPAAARRLIGSQLDRGQRDGAWLAIAEAEALLATHGLNVVPSHQCQTIDRAIAAAEQIGGPIALKADLPPPAYAGEIDAVLLGLHGQAAIRAGWEELERRVRQAGCPFIGAVLQRLMPPGVDVLVGTVIDPEFGRVMAVGLGGPTGGIAGTAAFRLPPATDLDAHELIGASEAVTSQLDGPRGLPPLDRDALRELVLRFALLLREARDRRGRSKPGAMHDQRLRRTQHAPTDPARATERTRQDLVIARAAGPIRSLPATPVTRPSTLWLSLYELQLDRSRNLAPTGERPAEDEHCARELPASLAIVEMIVELTIALKRGIRRRNARRHVDRRGRDCQSACESDRARRRELVRPDVVRGGALPVRRLGRGCACCRHGVLMVPARVRGRYKYRGE